MENHPTPHRIMQLGLGFWSSKCFLTAVEMHLFTHLAAGPLRYDELARRLSLHPRSARDFLDALVAMGMLAREHDIYANTPDTDLFLDRNKPAYIGGILEMASARLYPFWNALPTALRTGKPQNEAATNTTANPFDAIYADPARLKQFLSSMTGLSMGTSQAIAASFPWKEHRSFIDIGTAQGGLPVQLALAHPHLAGQGFDLPVVQPVFEDYIRSFHLERRIGFLAGNFLRDPLPTADVLTMGHILHDWDLEQKRMLIAKAYAALPTGGALLIFDAIIDDDRRQNAFGLLMSLNMLIETPGGFDYTGADCRQWLHEAGFKHTRVQPLTGPDSMVVGIK